MTRPSMPVPTHPIHRWSLALVLLAVVPFVMLSGCQTPDSAIATPDPVAHDTDADTEGNTNIEDEEQTPSSSDDGTTADSTQTEGEAVEVVPVAIKLAGDITSPDAEISSMAWHGDTLVLMPQYPGWARAEGAADGVVYAIDRDTILQYLDDADAEPITPREITFDAGGLGNTIEGFEGFEALAFDGDRVYLTVEAETPVGGAEGSQMFGYLVAGDVSSDAADIAIDSSVLTEVKLPVNLPNMSIESLLVGPSQLYAIFEANGVAVNPASDAASFSLDLAPGDWVAFPTIEYRVTDATALGPDGTFWVTNYFWPGEADLLLPAPDEVVKRHGEGPTHAEHDGVERLVQLQLGDNGITMTDRPPVLLSLLGDDDLRNWEGVVGLDDRGWLLATDSFPTTMLVFVPIPGNE